MKNLLVIAIAGALALTSCTGGGSDIIKKAEQGDAAAQLEYARLLKTTGNGVVQDWQKAVEMLQRSADNGNRDAQWELGLMYEFSDKVVKDESKALELYRRSAEAGSPIGLYMVAHCYQHGIVVEEDHVISDSLYAKSFDELVQLAPQEDIYVLNFIGSAYYWGDGVEADREKAFVYYMTSAKKGNPETQYKVGNCYETGQGTAKDMTEAVRWYQTSAAQGYPDAINALQRIETINNKTDMEKVRKALIETCEEMAKKARSMNMQGVAVASILPKESEVDWIGEMKVVDTPYNAEGGDKGWNLVAIAWSKAGEVIASGADSGNPDRKCMMGELNFTGGAYDETKNYKFAFAFSGGLSEDDLEVAKYGISYLKSLLNE